MQFPICKNFASRDLIYIFYEYYDHHIFMDHASKASGQSVQVSYSHYNPVMPLLAQRLFNSNPLQLLYRDTSNSIF